MVGEDGLQLALPGLQKLFHWHRFAACLEHARVRRLAQQGAHIGVPGQFQHKAAIGVIEQAVHIHARRQTEAKAIANAHFEQRFGHTAHAGRIGRQHLALAHQRVHLCPHGFLALRLGAQRIGHGRAQQHHLRARQLAFRADNLLRLARRHSKADQGGRHVNVFKRAGHGIFATDGGHAKIGLRVQRAQQRCHRLAPTGCVCAKALEIFLEGEVGLPGTQAGGHQFGDTFRHSQVCAVVRAFFADERVVAPRHASAGARLAVQHGNFIHHGLDGCELAAPAEGHQHSACADGGIEPF